MMAARVNISRRGFLARRFGPRLKLFLSYRRRYETASARLLKGDLTDVFGEGTVFLDVDDIAPGDLWTRSIREAVESCDVFLTLISPGWVELSGKLHEPGDFIREEIDAALTRRVPLIPVLVGGAQMPKPQSLPFGLRELTSRQAIVLSDRRWNQDVRLLVDTIRRIISERPPATFAERAVAAFRSLFGSRLGRLVPAVVLLAAAALAYVAVRNGLVFPSYETWVTGLSRPTPHAGADVEAGTYDSFVVRAARPFDSPRGLRGGWGARRRRPRPAARKQLPFTDSTPQRSHDRCD
jgi:hypothetical protein